MAARLFSRFSLRFRLLLVVFTVLAVMGAAMIVSSTVKERNEYRVEIADDAVTTLGVLEHELQREVVIGDYATIEQILRDRSTRDSIDEIAWVDARGHAIRSRSHNAVPDRPDWFAAWIGLKPRPESRAIEVGGVSYGTLTVQFTAVPLENRLWESFLLSVAMLAGMFTLLFALVAAILRQGLAPLRRLSEAASRIGSGNFGVRAAQFSGDAPEMRAALETFNRMAHDIEALMVDLSEQRRAIDNAAIVSETDLDGNITYVNEAFCDFSGYSQDELLGKTHRLVNSGVHPKEFFADLWRTIKAGEVWRGEVCNRNRRNELRWLATAITPVLDAEGKAAKFVAVRFDVTERKLAEQALRESHDELEEKVCERTADLSSANGRLVEEKALQEALIKKLEEAHNQLLQAEKMASIGQLAAGVAHEINNPVGFVNANMSTLKQYVADLMALVAAYEESEAGLAEDRRKRIEALKHEVDIDYVRGDIGKLLSESLEGLQRVKHIVDDLKDFSRVSEAERQWANLERGLDSTLNMVRNELKYKAEVVKEYGGISEIECFPSQLNQVFMNLLVNAAQAIEERGRVTIRTGEDDEVVWVEVEDTGHGIEPTNLTRIFDPFFTTKPVGKGTGLGLSLSYGIVQNHGGRIEVRSELGKGSVFRVILPRTGAPGGQLSPA